MAEKILIVDDDLETLRLVGLMLQRQGYDIVAASNGTQALQMAEAEQPHLILLDVMMPDLDGYEVARRLRSLPSTVDTPILMFTAKSQVDDKVNGYEAGVDDYLTKPTHPAELTAHVKSLLARASKTKTSPTAPTQTPRKQGHKIAVIGSKGGVGVSTITLNLSISLRNKTNADVIAAEIRPGQGIWKTELDLSTPSGFQQVLQYSLSDITPEVIEKEIIRHTSGIRLFLSSSDRKNIEEISETDKYIAIIGYLAEITPLLVLDFGTASIPGYAKLLGFCDEAIIVTEPNPTTIKCTTALLEDLSNLGFGKNKLVSIVLHNRIRSDIQLSWSQVQDSLGQRVVQVITPAPELAYQAMTRSMPLISVQPESLTTQQYMQLAEHMANSLVTS